MARSILFSVALDLLEFVSKYGILLPNVDFKLIGKRIYSSKFVARFTTMKPGQVRLKNKMDPNCGNLEMATGY